MLRNLILTGLILCSITIAQSQSLSVGIGGGYSLLESQDSYTATVDVFPYSWQREVRVVKGQKSDDGFNLVGQVRLGIPVLPLHLIAVVSYASLHGRSDSATATVPPWSSLAYQGGSLETRYSLFSVAAGLDWEVATPTMTPYASLRLALNRFGETKATMVNQFYSSEFSFEGRTRLGLSVGAGVRSDVLRSMVLDLQVNVLLNNVVGRQDGESVQKGFNVLAVLFYQLF